MYMLPDIDPFCSAVGLDEDMLVTTIPLNYYTTSLMLQEVMEKPLEKKAGRNYGPPGTKKLIYFIDDMNMPEVDTYGTVQPHTLIRQVRGPHSPQPTALRELAEEYYMYFTEEGSGREISREQ